VIGERRRRGLVVVLLVGLAAAGWWLWDLYWAPNRADLATYWQLVVAVVLAVPSMVTLIRDSWVTRMPGEDDRSELDRLADAVREQWDQAATARRLQQSEAIAVRWTQSAKPVAGSAAAAAASTRFPPLPGLAATRQEQLRSGGLRDLHTVYAGLRSGRLVIVGPPGAGKSGAAVLLVLAALRHRNAVTDTDRAKVPVPVLFTLHDWNPSTQPVQDWLVSQLRQTYHGLFIGRRGDRAAAALLRADKITVILDGLDEIIEPLRPLALQALNEQAVFRLVVLSRTAEIADAAQQTILEGAVAIELQDVDSAAAADYLTRVQRDPPPDRWRELISQLRTSPDSPITQALNNPLTLTLVRDTYRAGDTVGELLDFCASTERDITREDIVDHLLDRVLSTAYAPRPGDPPQPRYTPHTAQRTLQVVAARMSQDHTRDLAWWRIPSWTPVFPRVLAVGLASGLAVWFGLGILFGDFWLRDVGLDAGLVTGLGGMLGAWLTSRKPSRAAPTRWRFLFSHPSLVFVLGLLFGYVLTFFFVWRLAAWLIDALLIGFPVLVAGFLIMLAIRFIGTTHHRTVLMYWRTVPSYPSVAFVAGFGSGFLSTFAAAALFGFFGVALGFALVVLLLFGLSLWFGLGSVGHSWVSPLTPLMSWSQDRAARLGIWLGLGLLAGGLLLGLITSGGEFLGLNPKDYPFRNTFGLWLVAGLMLGLIFPETWSTSLACLELAIRWRTPIRLMRFFDDARERNILRTVGPIYQFRHARLQDRLAGQDITTATTATGSDTMPDQPLPPMSSTPPATSSFTNDPDTGSLSQ
jgi:hypothetical protein